MTCFSIQHIFRKGFHIALIGVLGCMFSVTAMAQKKKDEEEDLGLKVDAPIVIELYPATDCSACIFADRMLYDASKQKNVIALSCHVRDMDIVENSEIKNDIEDSKIDGPIDPCVFRQWTYETSTMRDETTVGVPMFYFNGYDSLNAKRMSGFKQMLNSYGYSSRNKTLEAMVRWKDNDTLSILLPNQIKKSHDVPNAGVWLIRYKDMAVEKVDSGINKGRVLRFSNIIQEITHIGKWRGTMRTIEHDVTAPLGGKERGGYAVVVAEMLGDPILAAGKVSDYPIANDLKKKSVPAP